MSTAYIRPDGSSNDWTNDESDASYHIWKKTRKDGYTPAAKSFQSCTITTQPSVPGFQLHLPITMNNITSYHVPNTLPILQDATETAVTWHKRLTDTSPKLTTILLLTNYSIHHHSRHAGLIHCSKQMWSCIAFTTNWQTQIQEERRKNIPQTFLPSWDARIELKAHPDSVLYNWQPTNSFQFLLITTQQHPCEMMITWSPRPNSRNPALS